MMYQARKRRAQRGWVVKMRSNKPWPDRLYMKFKYDSGIISEQLAAVGSGITQEFRGNALYDPDYTDAGHQPYGYDQFADMYRDYMVYASKIEVTIWPNQVNAVEMGVIPGPQGTFGDINTAFLREVARMKVKVAPSLRYHTSADNGLTSGTSKTLTYYCTTKAIYMDDLNVNDYGAAFGSNPNIEWDWHCIFRNVITPNHTETNFFQRRIIITYYCLLYGRREVANS